MNLSDMLSSRGIRSRRFLVIMMLLGRVEGTSTYTMIPRWGHATTLLSSPPTIVIHGGKTTSSGQTYTSSSNSGDTILLPLNTSFQTSSPPFTLVSSPGSPTSAWHTISSLSSSSDSWEVLSFGGDGGSSEAIQTLSDSAWIASINPSAGTASFTQQQTSWAAQPQRRIYHSASSPLAGGIVFITGGLKDDGSGQAYSDVYAFNPSAASPTFTTFPSLPTGLYHHSSVLLPNGTLLVFGGAYTSASTGNAALLPLSALYAMDTTSNYPEWVPTAIPGTAPSARRGQVSALNTAGNQVFIQGGADAALSSVFGDGWVLDLEHLGWTQIADSTSGPGSRFDHRAVAVDDQVVIFGGYGSSSPADADLYIFDMSKTAYVESFTAVSTLPSVSSAVGTTSGGSDAASEPTVLPGGSATLTPGATIATGPGMVSGMSSGASQAGSVPSSLNTDAGASAQSINSSTRLGIVLGLLGAVGLVAGLFIYRHRRRRRAQALRASMWPAGGPATRPARRPYGDREKGGEGLMDDSKLEDGYGSRKPDTSVGLGMGIGVMAGLSSVAGKLGSRSFSGGKGYSELNDEHAESSGLLRKSTRRVGAGIRLVGPRAQPQSNLTSTTAPPVSQISGNNRLSRFDMLGDEDSRAFSAISEGEEGEHDWVMGDEEAGLWKSANSLLGQDGDDEDEAEDFAKPIRGGPVPTPPVSINYRDPFTDDSSERDVPNSTTAESSYKLPSLSPSNPLDLSGLLLPPRPAMARGASESLPSSQRSRISHISHISTTGSEQSEGIVQHAQMVTPYTASVVSPSEVGKEYAPIQRSESFLHRISGGLLGSSSKPLVTRGTYGTDLNIRDPAPLPPLWPLNSIEDISKSTPPSSFVPPHPGEGHMKGPSVASLNSARSMRDMTIIQREITEDSTDVDQSMIAETGVMEDEDEYREGGGHRRHGGTGVEIPGSIVFNGPSWGLNPFGEDNTSGTDFTPSVGPKTPSGATSTPTQPSSITPDSPSTPTPTPVKRTSLQNSSPLPIPLPSARRPVREVVESINKRSIQLPSPMALFSPQSQYSPVNSPPPSPSTKRRPLATTRASTTYEAVRRSPLTVANPDKRKGSSSGSSV